MPPDSPVNSGSSEDSGETSGGGGGTTPGEDGGSTTPSGPVATNPSTWEVSGTGTLSVPSGANVTAEAIQEAQSANEGSSITAITFEGSVTIGADAFRGNRSITSVTGWENVISIGDNAFKNTNISGELNLSSATTIGASAFKGCTGITGVTFGEGVTIADGDDLNVVGAFSNCSNLTTVTFNGRATIGTAAFAGSGLNSVTFNGNATIGEAAFQACTSLTSVDGWENVTSIGNNGFYNTSLTSVELGEGLEKLDFNAFGRCTSLKSADLSACRKLTRIESGMFDRCTSLQAVFLSESIDQIGVAEQTPVFDKCTNDQVTVYTKRTKDKEEITFGKTDDSRKIKDGIQYGKTEGDWNTLLEQLHITPEGTSLLSGFSTFRDLLS